MIGNGKVAFCPALVSKGSSKGSQYYEKRGLLTASENPPDSLNAGSVRTSYINNPWTVDPFSLNGSLTQAQRDQRLMQKSSQIPKRKLFGMDFIDSSSWQSDGDVNIASTDFAHSRSKGWNVMFTDISVEFKKVSPKVKTVFNSKPGAFQTQYDIEGICLLARDVFE
ncbi:MAG: hypothetical protein QM813_16675 [Verrucomicrobiota bacterium]